MLSRIRKRETGPPPDTKSVNFTSEHLAVSKTVARRKKVLDVIWKRLPLIRVLLATAGFFWLLALPYEGLWKGTYVDEHALQPAQVTTYFDWGNVHKADQYLDKLEQIVNSTFEERTTFLQDTFSSSGLYTSNTTRSTYAHIKPPRSKGTESIIVSANWKSRDGEYNLRGIATLLALGDFLRGQNQWAFDIILVIGESYMEGLENFMKDYHNLFSGVIWTALNVDYPGHSFSHIGLFYESLQIQRASLTNTSSSSIEGINGRLPNQDIINTVQRTSQFTGGVPTRFHNIPDDIINYDFGLGLNWEWLGKYILASKHLLHHFGYMITGRASAAHGVFARHRIDSLTLYCTPSTGPHGFHTLGKTLESSLRSLNNLLERLHASYFFYLLPRPWNFIPVGQYLPSAILLGASLTLGGFDCPSPIRGLGVILPGFGVSFLAWWIDLHPIHLIVAPFLIMYFHSWGTKHETAGLDVERRKRSRTMVSAKSLILLSYGSLISTISMINFPQSIFLSLISISYLTLPEIPRLLVLGITQPGLFLLVSNNYMNWNLDLHRDYTEFGNLTWPVGVYAIWLPLWINSTLLLLLQGQ